MTARRFVLIAVAILFIGSPPSGFGDWPCRPDLNVSITTDIGNQWNPRSTGDGKGGALVVWQDRRAGTNDKIYIQCIDASGNPVWQPGGIPIAPSSGLQYYPEILPDGLGGAFIVWQENRTGSDYDIFAQRVSPTGALLWNATGTAVCNTAGHQYYPQITNDGTGGIIITWQDRRNGNFDIFAQRFNPTGQTLWQSNGMPVCASAADQLEPQITTDGLGGAIIAWSDYRTDISDVYVQRLSHLGESMWRDGIIVCEAPNAQMNVQIVPDSAHGAIICWQDRRSGINDIIFAQRVTEAGEVFWPIDGIPVTQAIGLQYYPRMVVDRKGGAVIVWQDNRLGSDYDIYGQRLNPGGTRLWQSMGLPVFSGIGHQYNPQVMIDSLSVIVSWQDQRGGADFDIYAQRVYLSGSVAWLNGGVCISNAPNDQFIPQIANDMASGAIITWMDYRLASGAIDLFAQRIGANGKLAGGCYRTFSRDALAEKALRIRTLRKPPRMPNAGNVRDSVFGRGVFPDGVILGIEKRDSIRDYGWERVTRPLYARRALPQTGSPRRFTFVGEYKIRSPRRNSNRVAAELLALRLNIAASDIEITESNLGDLLYQDPAGKKHPFNNLSLRQIASFVDSTLTLWRTFPTMSFTQIDTSLRNINRAFEGKFDTISTSPLRVTSTGALFTIPFLLPNIRPPVEIPQYQPMVFEDEIPREIELDQNYPNPFNPLTTIEFSLAVPARTTLRVFNVLGQQVAVLLDNIALDEGAQVVDFDASTLASGMYFYQLIAEPLDDPGGAVIAKTKKMMFLK